MADTAVLRVDVASADFDKFKTTFDQYAKTLEQTLATWSKITTEVKAASAAMTNMAAPVARSTASLQKFAQQFAETAKHSTSIRANVESITKGLVSWKTAVGSTLALLGLGGGGLFGLTSLVNSVVGDRNRALATGVSYGQFRGMNAGSFPGAGAAMQGWGTARWDPTSGAYRGAQTLFGSGTDRQLSRTDPKAMVDALDKASQYLGQFDEKIRGAIAATSGLNDFLGTEALRTWQTLTEQAKKGNEQARLELEQRRKALIAAGEAADAAAASVVKWTTFNIKLESAKSIIQDVLIDKLSPLAKPLGDLSDAILKAFTAFMQTKAVQETIQHFGDELQKWADWLKTTEGQESFNRFMEKLGKAASILATFVDTIARIIALVAQSPVGRLAGTILGAVPGAVQGLEKEGIGSTHFSPITQDDKDRNLRLGRDRLGGQINPDGSSANFPNPGDAVKATTDPSIQAVPWYRQKNFGFRWGKSNNDPSTPGNAAETPGPTMAAFSVGGQNAQLGERMMTWFGQESMATQRAADAAERRDTKLERLLVAMENWFRSTSGKAGGGGVGAYGASDLGGGGGGGGVGAEGGDTSGVGTNYGPTKLTGDAKTDAILKTIRSRESGGNYSIHSKSSSASGAYQFTDSTWRSMTKKFGIGSQYGSAADAPAEIQDKVAAAYVGDILQQAHGDVSKVPLAWYTGNIQGKISASALAANKGLTPETYQRNWMSTFNKFGGGAVAGGGAATADATSNSTSEIRGPGGGNAADANALLAEVKAKNPHLSNEQCVTLVKEFAGMGGTVRDWRKGQNAMAGGLKVGQPIATFMSASGQQSDRYDAGGVGTPGAGTSHAALFGGYTRDKQGNITGMNVVEQYSRSGGPRTQHYGVGGFGEHGAQNYFAIAAKERQLDDIQASRTRIQAREVLDKQGELNRFEARRGPQRQASLNGLDNDNWQQKPVNHVQIHNKTGSDVNIAASTVMTST
jgi:methyl-accepting chemotaxis protein